MKFSVLAVSLLLLSTVVTASSGDRKKSGKSHGGSSSSGGNRGISRIFRPDRAMTGMTFDDTDIASCTTYLETLLVRPSSDAEDLSDATLKCAKIGSAEPPIVHCSVVFETTAGNFFMMDLTPNPPGDEATQLLIRCRMIAQTRDHAEQLNIPLYLGAYHDATGKIRDSLAVYHGDNGLTTPYIVYPATMGWFPLDPSKGVSILRMQAEEIRDDNVDDLYLALNSRRFGFRRVRHNSHAAALYLWLKKVPPFFQLLTHDCQTFATTVLNHFCRPLSPVERANDGAIAKGYINLVYSKPASASYVTDPAVYATTSAIHALESRLESVATNLYNFIMPKGGFFAKIVSLPVDFGNQGGCFRTLDEGAVIEKDVDVEDLEPPALDYFMLDSTVKFRQDAVISEEAMDAIDRLLADLQRAAVEDENAKE